MQSLRNPTSAIGRVREKLQQTGQSVSETPLFPGDRVEVLDMAGSPTGIHCTVRKAESHAVGVMWGGETITVGRWWLRKVS